MKKINKMLLLALLGITLLFITTGCQRSETSETSETDAVTSTSAPTQAETESRNVQEESGTRIVSTVMGDIEVPANPKRVLVDYIVGDVVAMGVKPIALSTLDTDLEGTAFEKEVEGLEYIGWGYDPETVMALEPDLIILSWSDEGYEELSKIAPTIYIPYGEMTTEERVMLVGEALNKAEEARQVLNDFDTKVEQSIQSLKDAGVYDKFVTVAQYSNGQAYVAGNKHAVGRLLYDTMGFPVLEKVQTDIIDADKYWGDISLEVFPEYVGDYFIHLGDYPEDWETNEIINSIPTMKEGKTFTLNTQLTWYSDIYSASALVDKITSQLIALAK
ncbi:MAG: hypothetical protein K0S04_1079 [Herbinix sp.]|jgi:iron complex transport system substrate-binding protein|nr:hypothetical protein [Herbinix sp.]